MVLVCTPALGLERAPVDWRAACVDALVHATLILWLLNSGWNRPDLPISASMVLVSLWEPPVAGKVAERPSAMASAAAQRRATPERSSAAPQSQKTRRQYARAVIAPTADKLGETGSQSLEAAAPASDASLSSDGTRASLALRGNAGYTGPRFRSPKVKRRVIPNYPAEALRAGQQGTVNVLVTIAADGRAVEARIARPSGAPALDEASIAAALAYTYQPGERNGVPVEAQGLVTIDWKIGPKTIEHVGAGPLASSREAEQKRLDCLGNGSHDIDLRRNAALCGPVKRR